MLSVFVVRRNGELTSGSEFCNEDDLTLTCCIGDIAVYAWTVSGLVMDNDGAAVVGLGTNTIEVYGLTFTLMATSNGPSSVSILCLTVSGLLNGRNITCGAAGQAPIGSQVVNILGMLC